MCKKNKSTRRYSLLHKVPWKQVSRVIWCRGLIFHGLICQGSDIYSVFTIPDQIEDIELIRTRKDLLRRGTTCDEPVFGPSLEKTRPRVFLFFGR